MREIRKESEVAVFCSSDQAAGKCFERGKYIASHTDVLRAGVGHAFLPHGGADTRDEPLRMSAWEASRYIIPFSRIPRFNSSKNINCFFRNLKRFQTLPLVGGRLNRRPCAFCDSPCFRWHDTLSQFSGYPEKLSSKPPRNSWCLFANAKQF